MKEQSVIIKHSSVIQASNATPRLARQLWNSLLFLSFDDLLSRSRHAASLDTVLDTLDVTTRNVEHLKDSLRVLQTTLVEFNILHKDRERWESSTLLAGASIEAGVVSWEFSQILAQRLANPRIYAKIRLSIQARFGSKYSLALYELCLDYYDEKRRVGETPWIEVKDLRKLLGAEEEYYHQFKKLNQKVIQRGRREVNKKGDIHIDVEYQKDGRTVTAVKFKVRPRRPTPRREAIPTPHKNGYLSAEAQPGLFGDGTPAAFKQWWATLPAEEQKAVDALAFSRLEDFEKNYYRENPEGTIARTCMEARRLEIWEERIAPEGKT